MNKELRIKKQENKNLLFVIRSPLSGEGFTLIEILVAATILGILSTIGISSFQAVTRSGRDALRRADLEQIRSALEIYKSENGSYPDAANCTANLTADYINPYPSDPKAPTYKYCYVKNSSLQYNLCTHLENGSGDYDADCGGDDACGDDCNYKVSNP